MTNPWAAPSAGSRRTLERGVLIYRWVALIWMITIAIGSRDFRRPLLAWGSIGLAAAWTAALGVGGERLRRRALAGDLLVCTWLMLASGAVVPDGTVDTRPFFATGYPINAALLWGVARGPIAGLGAGTVLAIALGLSRPINGIPLTGLELQEFQSLAGGFVNYLVAGTAVGVVSRVLARSEHALRVATDELVRTREHAARLAEREKLARQIHDSVLQFLALVHKSGRERTRASQMAEEELARLSELAGQQEAELRALILRPPEEAAPGLTSLRVALEEVARTSRAPSATVSTVGPLPLARSIVEELGAAVKQALDNVAEHASATKTSIFAEMEGSDLVLTVRDDGRGFVYDESALRASAKAGILKSMKGRIEDLGGGISVTSVPGRGTEIEFRLPIERGEP